MQSRGSEAITESANANIVGKYYVSKNKTNITILLLTNQCFFLLSIISIINLVYHFHIDFLQQPGRNNNHKITDESSYIFKYIVNLGNILNHEDTTSHFPEYFQTPPIVAYNYKVYGYGT